MGYSERTVGGGVMNKIQAAEQLRKALQMFAQSLTDEQAMEIATIYPEWKVNTKYYGPNDPDGPNSITSFGENSTGDPQLYRCAQSHTSQTAWTPDSTPALWVAIGLAPDGVPVWSQPTGAHDAYNTGDRVHFPDKNGPIYRSKFDGNAYSPEIWPDGWELET